MKLSKPYKAHGYVHKSGIIFVTNMRIVEVSGEYVCQPRIIAEPGDLINVEGDLLSNLSRAALGDPRVRYFARNAKLVLPIAC